MMFHGGKDVYTAACHQEDRLLGTYPDRGGYKAV
jgi:hypothetical protein